MVLVLVLVLVPCVLVLVLVPGVLETSLGIRRSKKSVTFISISDCQRSQLKTEATPCEWL